MSNNWSNWQPHNQKFSPGQLNIINLSCWRGCRRLFKGIDINLKNGEMLALSGSNGIGKSSLLAVLAGLLNSYQGQITFHDRLLVKTDVTWLGVALPFYPDKNLYDNLLFWAVLSDCHPSSVDYLLDVWQLNSSRNRLFHQLSRGQQQRVHLSRLLLDRSPIWLLDEPLTGLDSQGLMIFKNQITCYLKRGGIVITAPPVPDITTKIIYITNFTTDDIHQLPIQGSHAAPDQFMLTSSESTIFPESTNPAIKSEIRRGSDWSWFPSFSHRLPNACTTNFKSILRS